LSSRRNCLDKVGRTRVQYGKEETSIKFWLENSIGADQLGEQIFKSGHHGFLISSFIIIYFSTLCNRYN